MIAATELLWYFFSLLSLYLILLFLKQCETPYKWISSSPPRHANHWPLVGSLKFFNARWEFWESAGVTGNFSFMLGRFPVVGLRGEQSRRVFFNDRRLNFYDGYNVLYGAAPDTPSQPSKSIKQMYDSIEDSDATRFDRFVINRFTKLLQKEYYEAAFPDLLVYTREGMRECCNSPAGLFDPFQVIYRLIFRHTVRVVCCEEIAADTTQLTTFSAHFERMGTTFGPVGIVAPVWMPTPGRITCLWSAFGMHRYISHAADQRRQGTKTKHRDGLQLLLDQGDSTDLISRFIISGLFAGQLNTALDAAYLLCYLACDPIWLARVRAEIEGLVREYAPDASETLEQRLARVPYTAWMNDCPIIDVVLLETIRFVTLGTALRFNETADQIAVGGGQHIPGSVCVAYHLGDVHFDSNIYPDPDRWDPSRYTAGTPGAARASEEFLGWGRGLHPCPGKALAKLETGLVIAHFVMQFDFELCDADGKSRSGVPVPNKNAPVAEKPRVPLRLRVQPRGSNVQ